MTTNAPDAMAFVPISEEIEAEVGRLVEEALPTSSYANTFGRPQMRRWTRDRVMERLATGEGATHMLEDLIQEESSRCPTGWSSGRPALRSQRDVPLGIFRSPVSPSGYWTFEPTGAFMQAEDGSWHYRLRAEGEEQDVPFPWMVEYVKHRRSGE